MQISWWWAGWLAVLFRLCSALVEQPLDDLVVAPGRSRLRRVTVSSSLCVDVGPLVEQPLDDLVVAPGRSRLQRVAVFSSLCVDVGLLVEQPLDDLVMALGRSRI